MNKQRRNQRLWSGRAISCLTLAGALAQAGAAQTAVDGVVAGTAMDVTGAALPNATIRVHSSATNADTAVVADSAGYFRASRLAPGDYTVEVTAVGFAAFTVEHVIVEVGKLTEIRPRLAAGSAASIVEVTADPPLLNSETSDFSTVFTPAALNSLPINGRHWTSFALLSPGVTAGNSAYGLASFRGLSNLQNNFMVDGSDDNDSFDGVERGYTRVGYTTPQDAVLEFQVVTSNGSAQYGRAVGGGVNAVTRSGGNAFHGDAFWYYRDNQFGATNPFNTLAVTNPGGGVRTIFIKPKDKRHQYGGTFTGPLVRNKLFFLYSFDQQRRNFPALAAPTPQFLQASNAAVNNCTVASGGTTDAVSCAISRGATLAQVNAALAYIGGQSGVTRREGNQIISFGKLDYAVSARNAVSLIYDRMRWDSPNGIQTNPVVRRGLTSFGNDFIKIDSVIGKIDTLITPRSSNELRVNYARTLDTENGNTPLSNEPATTAGGLPPGLIITPNSGFSVGTPYYLPRSNYPNEAQSDVVENITLSHGSHTINVGAEYRWAQDNIVDVDYQHGLFTYSLLADFLTDFSRTLGSSAGCTAVRNSTRGTLPCYSNLQQAFGRPQFVFHTNDYAIYAQDDWRVGRRLTLNLGVRYDHEQLPSPKIPNAAAAQTAQFPTDTNNIAPRFGFAWDAFGAGRTVVRGGFGLYYGRMQNGTIFKALSATGSSSAQFQLNTSPSATSPVYPVIVSTATPPAVSNVVGFAPGFQNPVSDQFNLSVQQDLGFHTVLTVAYLGTLGKQLPNFVDSNIAPATTTRTYSFVNGPLAGDRWTVPVYTARRNPLYNALTLITSNVNTNYDALSVVVEHRLSRGVQFGGSYTWSKALDFGMNQSAASDTNDQADPLTIRPDYGLSVNDIPQRFVGNLILSPHLSKSNRYLSEVANGWTIAPVWTVQSGIPYSYGLSGGTTIPGGASTYNGSGGLSGGAAQSVNFQAYPQYAASDVFNGAAPRRNSLRQATIADVDVRLSRAFSFLEKYKVILGGEAFNILNRQQFTSYNTTAYALSETTATYQATFGTPSAAGNTVYRERQFQFVTRFEF